MVSFVEIFLPMYASKAWGLNGWVLRFEVLFCDWCLHCCNIFNELPVLFLVSSLEKLIPLNRSYLLVVVALFALVLSSEYLFVGFVLIISCLVEVGRVTVVLHPLLPFLLWRVSFEKFLNKVTGFSLLEFS